MKRIFPLTILILFLSSLSLNNLYSDLKDFKQDFKKEESEKSRSTKSRNDSSSSSNDGCSEAIGEFTFYVFIAWVQFNFALRYNNYPYQFQDSNNFIFHYHTILQKRYPSVNNENAIINSDVPSTNDMNAKDDEDAAEEINDMQSLNKGTEFEDKNYYFTLEGGYQYAFDNGNGAFAALRGKFYKLIGPEIEARRIIDNNDHLDYFAFGLNIPVIQFSGFMPDLYLQKIYLKGIIERDGFAYGIIVNSYPVKPFSFMIRIGEQSYNNIKGKDYGKVDFMDYEIRAGIVYNHFELFIGFRHMKAKYAEIKGPEIGLKIII